jgi:hypothetical protein
MLRNRHSEYATVWTVRILCPGREKFSFSFSSTSTGSAAQPASGYWSSFPGIKRPGLLVNKSLPSSAEVKNIWSHNSAPDTSKTYAFMAWTGKAFNFT